MPALAMAFSSINFTPSPAAMARSATVLASAAGVADPPGSFTRSRANATASPTTRPRCTPEDSSRPSFDTTTMSRSLTSDDL